jgi:signal transduction histidine kinase
MRDTGSPAGGNGRVMMLRRIIPRSVTVRLVTSYSLLLLILGVVSMGVTTVSFRYFTRQTLTQNLIIRDQDVWRLTRGTLDDPARVAQLVERWFAPETQNRFIRIRVGDKVIYRSGDPDAGTFVAARVPQLDPRTGPHVAMIGNLLLYSRVYALPGRPDTIIDMGRSYHLVQAMERRLFKSLLIGLPLLLGVATLAGYWLMRRALAPVETMIKAAEAYTFNDPHKRLPIVRAEPRMAALGMALNRILERLDGAYSHVSRFATDAAHELRTPLTIIRGELEQVAGGRLSSEEASRTLAGALEEMDRLDATVDTLIVLSRLEGLPSRRLHNPVDLARLANQAAIRATTAAAGKGIDVVHVPGAPVMVMGDGDQLARMLSALLDNAVKFTPEGGQVTVEAGAEGGMGFVTVEDCGIGIDPRHHERVFDRFYRIQPARGDRSPGLGLSIVRAVVMAHGGRVSLRSVPDLGSVFRVELPLAEPKHRMGGDPLLSPDVGAVG